MKLQSQPLKALRPPQDLFAHAALDVTLADLPLYIRDDIDEADLPVTSPLGLVPPDLRNPLSARIAPASSGKRRPPHASARLMAALRDAVQQEQVVPKDPIAWRRRFFNGRAFLLWVEDVPEWLSATIFARDEVSGLSGWLHVPDTALRMSFRHFMSVRQGGLAAALGVGQRTTCRLSELPVGEFLQSLLDVVYFEANSFGDEWEIRLPGIGPRTRREELGEGFGPEMSIAAAPGRAPRPWEMTTVGKARCSAGPLPPSSTPPSTHRRPCPWRPPGKHRPATSELLSQAESYGAKHRPATSELPSYAESLNKSPNCRAPRMRSLTSRLGSLLPSHVELLAALPSACGTACSNGPVTSGLVDTEVIYPISQPLGQARPASAGQIPIQCEGGAQAQCILVNGVNRLLSTPLATEAVAASCSKAPSSAASPIPSSCFASSLFTKSTTGDVGAASLSTLTAASSRPILCTQNCELSLTSPVLG